MYQTGKALKKYSREKIWKENNPTELTQLSIIFMV